MKKDLILNCSCNSIVHTIVCRIEIYEDDVDLTLNVQMQPLPWYKRIASGLKYIFGNYSSMPRWEETLLSRKESEKLVKFLNEFHVMESMVQNVRRIKSNS